jgi:hypothetical protein
MDNEEIKKRIRAANAKANNGRVLRVINILRIQYIKLRDARSAMPDMKEGEFQDSINYLAEAEYIEMRHIETRAPVTTSLADHDYRELEAKLTKTGIQLLGGFCSDPLVEV